MAPEPGQRASGRAPSGQPSLHGRKQSSLGRNRILQPDQMTRSKQEQGPRMRKTEETASAPPPPQSHNCTRSTSLTPRSLGSKARPRVVSWAHSSASSQDQLLCSSGADRDTRLIRTVARGMSGDRSQTPRLPAGGVHLRKTPGEKPRPQRQKNQELPGGDQAGAQGTSVSLLLNCMLQTHSLRQGCGTGTATNPILEFISGSFPTPASY